MKHTQNLVTKFLSALIVLMMLCSWSLAASLDTPETDPIIWEYKTINSLNASISFKSEKATCTVSAIIRADENESREGKATMRFYEKNGTGWNYVGGWSATSTINGTIADSRSFKAKKGTTYKLTVSVKTSKETQSTQKIATY